MISMVGRDCEINRKANASAAQSSAASITEIVPSALPESKRRHRRSKLEAQAAPSLHTLSKTKRAFSHRPAQSAAVKQRIRLFDAGSDSAFAIVDFNTLYFESPSDSTGFALDNLLIETGAAPEPSRMVLLALGCCRLLLRRRR